MAELIFDEGTLRAEKARRQFTNEYLAAQCRRSVNTIIRALRGRESVKLDTLRDVAGELGLRVKVTFEPLCSMCGGTGSVLGGTDVASWHEDCSCVREGRPVPVTKDDDIPY